MESTTHSNISSLVLPVFVHSISTPHVKSYNSRAISCTPSQTNDSVFSLSIFVSDHFITWDSFNPGGSTLGMKLSSCLGERLDHTIVEVNEFCTFFVDIRCS